MARVFVTGGSGFVGSTVIDELLRRNHDVTALQERRPVDPRGGSVRIVKGGLLAVENKPIANPRSWLFG